MAKGSFDRLSEFGSFSPTGKRVDCADNCNYLLKCGKEFQQGSQPCIETVGEIAHKVLHGSGKLLSGVKSRSLNEDIVETTGFVNYGREVEKRKMPIPGSRRRLTNGQIFKP